jgi:hypothetical protein
MKKTCDFFSLSDIIGMFMANQTQSNTRPLVFSDLFYSNGMRIPSLKPLLFKLPVIKIIRTDHHLPIMNYPAAELRGILLIKH